MQTGPTDIRVGTRCHRMEITEKSQSRAIEDYENWLEANETVPQDYGKDES